MRTINYKVSYEKLISRLPAMFAFLEFDNERNCEIRKATLGKQGNYGEIVANIAYPYKKVITEFIDKDNVYYNGQLITLEIYNSLNDNNKEFCESIADFNYTCEDGTILQIVSGKEYTYRTLIDTYYKAINDIEWERDSNGNYTDFFLSFMEKGIGLKYVGLSEEISGDAKCGVKTKNTFPLAPDYIYLGEARVLYDKMIKMKKQIDFWKKHTKSCKEDVKYYLRTEEEYKLRNGDKLIEKLWELINESEQVANEYYGYAQNTNLTLDFNINFVNTIKDLGIVTPYIQEWVAGKRYYNGDIVYYVDENGYGMTWECTIDEEKSTKVDDYGRHYTEGFYDENNELILFDGENWKIQSLNWVDENRVFDGEEQPKYYRYAVTDDNTIPLKTSEQNEKQTISGTVNSQLTSLRRFTTYTNRYDEAEYPYGTYDWLWYYRIGTIVNMEAKYDMFGNMAAMYKIDESSDYVGVESITNNDNIGDNLKENTDGYITNLAVWGDIITNITAKNIKNENYGVITFNYVIGAHLLAKKDNDNGNWYSTDDDGNYKYFFKDFVIDENAVTHGVKYEESYIYYKGSTNKKVISDFVDNQKEYYAGQIISFDTYNNLSDENKEKCKNRDENIWNMVADGEFKDYVNGKFDYHYIPYAVVTKQFEQVENKTQGIVEITKKYYIGEIVNKKIYAKYQSNCQWEGAVETSFTFTKDFKGGDEIEETLYNILKKYAEYVVNMNTFDGKHIASYDFTVNLFFNKNDEISKSFYDSLSLTDKSNIRETYSVSNEFNGTRSFKKGEKIDYATYILLSSSHKENNCEIIDDVKETNTDYYKFYDKMEFDASRNINTYKFEIGNRKITVPYRESTFTTTVDITHVDVEKTPLIRYDYYNGVSFQPTVNDDVDIERGLTQAFEKHIKFGEIKTLEDLENYANGGYFTISKEDIDLG